MIGEAGFAYDGRLGARSLRDVLAALITDEDTVERYRGLAAARARSRYCWDRVADRYEAVFARLLRRAGRGTGAATAVASIER